MGAIQNDWLQAVGGEFRKPYYKELYDFVKEEYSTRVIYPPADDIFNALHLTPLKEVKVVILGQDPYHNEHQAHGLSFSVLPDQREIPPSLQNIYKELHDDLGCYIPDNGYLEKWARQGVLMLNTVLTVRAHQANSHQGHGWEQFTDAILEAVNQEDRPIVYLLWGGPEQDPDADESKASDLESASSKPIVCLPRILRMPPFQPGQRVFREPWGSAD